MNKKVFILPLLLALTITGCKGNKKGNKKGDVINDLVLKANTTEDKKYIFSNFHLSETSLPVSDISSATHNNGFLEIIDTEGTKHYYSLIKNREIFSTKATVTSVASSLVGGVAYFTEDGKTNVYDALGNRLISDAQSVSSVAITSGSEEDTLYIDVFINNKQHHYYTYNENGVASLTVTIVSGDSSYEQGSSLQGIEYEFMDDFGHAGYKKFKNSDRYVIFDNKNNEVASFTDPQADVEFFVGDYLIYQNSVKVDDNNNNYDYINSAGERFTLETYRINYLTAKKETLKIKHVFSTGVGDIHSFYNEKKVYSYVYANLRTISDKKVLSNTPETYIVDASGALHDNVTGIDLGAFRRFGNNYYNTSSQTIYDGYLNELSILNNIHTTFIPNAELIVCEKNGNFGAVNHEGKIAIPFEYDQIFSEYATGDYLLAVKNGIVERLTFDARNCVISNTKQFPGYTAINYQLSEAASLDGVNYGAGIFTFAGSETSEQPYPNYYSIFADQPLNIQQVNGSVMTTMISTAEVIDKCVFFSLERLGSTYSAFASSININH